MKAVLAALLGVALVASAMSDYEQWVSFKNKYGTHHKMGEEAYRFEVFKSNLRASEKLQAESTTASYGVTQFMDLTPDEFHTRYANLNVTAYRRSRIGAVQHKFTATADNIVDWKAKGMVSSVKDQGQCGSCWAFATVAALESCWLMHGNKEVAAAPQQLVDCCTAGGSEGCNGGYPQLALQEMVTKDVYTNASYPYTAQDGTCKVAGKKIAIPANTCKYVQVENGEDNMANALVNAPLSIALAADILQYYNGGIISGSECTKYKSIDHAVFLVANNGAAYTIKNSWGSSWGEAGYFRVTAGKNCLKLATMSSYAL